MPPVKWDWDKLRTEYICGNISLLKLSEKHGVPYKTINHRSTKERWGQQKIEYRSRVGRRAVEKLATKAAGALAEEFEVANEITKVLRAALRDAQQFNRYVGTEGQGMGESELVERVFSKVDMRALESAAKTLATVEQIKRGIAGLLTVQDEHKIDMDKRRLKLEEQKGIAQDGATFTVKDPFVEVEPEDGDNG